MPELTNDTAFVSLTEHTSVADYYTSLETLANPDVSYRLIDTYAMKLAMRGLDGIIARATDIRTRIAAQFHRTLKEYMEGEIYEADGIRIIKIKDGRAELDKNKARELYPNEVAKVETRTKHFDKERFKTDNPELYAKYLYETANVTLTDLRNGTDLTPEQLEKCINRAADTYNIRIIE